MYDDIFRVGGMIVDSHLHLWQIGRNGHVWPTPDLTAIYRDYGEADLLKETMACGVDRSVLVQSQPSESDTSWILDIAATLPQIGAVVGWTDMAATEGPERIRDLSAKPKLAGLRPMLQGLPDDDWIISPKVRPSLETMAELGLVFDALVFTRHLRHITTIARELPELRIVIDHGAKPPIANATINPAAITAWRDAIEAAAQCDNIVCKLSGLLTEAGKDQVESVLTPFADHLLNVFGADRILWGSDWPVVSLERPYRFWWEWTCDWLSGKSPTMRDAILGGNAARLYQLT